MRQRGECHTRSVKTTAGNDADVASDFSLFKGLVLVEFFKTLRSIFQPLASEAAVPCGNRNLGLVGIVLSSLRVLRCRLSVLHGAYTAATGKYSCKHHCRQNHRNQFLCHMFLHFMSRALAFFSIFAPFKMHYFKCGLGRSKSRISSLSPSVQYR